MSQPAPHPNKDVRKIVRRLVGDGWEVVKSGKHYKIRSPNGRHLSIARTPSCFRVLNNIERDIKRILSDEQTL